MIVETKEVKEKEMILETPTREKEEKTGTILNSEQQKTEQTAEKKSDRELLESINAKIDMMLATQKANMEV